MATTALVAAMRKAQKYSIRYRNRCKCCGRPRGYLRKFQMCRICFRNLALQGLVPGVTKSSW
ncbi:MAG: type Z 30S ribosomal protein S14 [Acidobacteria bacterium]|jgi:small subunit ribosomal protein S14|nr:type Z 30S ribosomal protein S14 [Acidobacteriota bacterium]